MSAKPNKMKPLPQKFIERTKAVMGEERYSRYTQALENEPSVSIRINPFKWHCSEGEPVPWCSEGRYLAKRPDFTLDPLLHGGAYYVQEASSMFVAYLLRQLVKEPVKMLDLCAAPGGKSTAARTVLPDESVLFANEPNGKRAQILLENIQKFGHERVVVTQCWPRDFGESGLLFDVMLADVPCSGEGMFRKDDVAIDEWSEANVRMCQQRQREIVSDAWDCLRKDGLLIYSTCTLNTEENEENVRWIAEELGAEPVDVPVEPDWGITGSLLKGYAAPVYRFIPGYTRGEGLFMAALRKISDTANASKSRSKKPLRTLANGIEPPTKKGNDIVPSHAEALSRGLDRTKYPMQELARNEALSYLRRETLIFSSEVPKGYVVVCYEGVPLGFVKNLGTRANNLYPQNWKIRKL